MNTISTIKIIRECILTVKYCSIPAQAVKTELQEYIKSCPDDSDAQALAAFIGKDFAKYYYCTHELAHSLVGPITRYQVHQLHHCLILRIVTQESPFSEAAYSFKDSKWKPVFGVPGLDMQNCDLWSFSDITSYSLDYMSVRDLETMITGHYLLYHRKKDPEVIRTICNQLNSSSNTKDFPSVCGHAWVDSAKLYSTQLQTVSKNQLLKALSQALNDSQKSGALAGVELRTRLHFIRRFIQSDYTTYYYFYNADIQQYTWQDFVNRLRLRVYSFSVINYQSVYNISTAQWNLHKIGTYVQNIHGISALQYFEQKLQYTNDSNIIRTIAYKDHVKYNGDLCGLYRECESLNKKPRYFICNSCKTAYCGTPIADKCPVCMFKQRKVIGGAKQ